MNRLRSATAAQQNLLESLVRDFLEGKIAEDVFSIQCVEVARIFHRRSMIMEKWDAGAIDWKS